MAKKPIQEDPAGGNEWLATYSDMVTLLFAFFVILFAISQVDVKKFNLLASALSNKGASPELIMQIAEERGLKTEGDPDLEDPKIPTDEESSEDSGAEAALKGVYDDIMAHISGRNIDDKIAVSLGNDYIFIRFMDDMLFDPNSARISSEDYELLSFIGQGLKAVQNDIRMIRIDGHTADFVGSDDYFVSDRTLSSQRADAVLIYFEDVIGIDPNKLTSFALGKRRPIADNSTPEGRAQNRRIEILITSDSIIDLQLNNIYEKIAQ